jgi:hypothetical protein
MIHFQPIELVKAFQLTDRVLLHTKKEPSAKAFLQALNQGGCSWEKYTQDFQDLMNGKISDALQKAGKPRLDLSFYFGEEGLSRLLREKKTLWLRKYPGKSEAEIRHILESKGAGHFSPSHNYLLFNFMMRGSKDVQNLDIQMMYLHELTHVVDSASAPDIFKKVRYLKNLEEGKTLQDLSDTYLQNLLNTVYLEEHAYGQTIRLLNKNFKDTKNPDLKMVAKSHTTRLKTFRDAKKSVIQEMKRRKEGDAVSKEAKEDPLDKIKIGLAVVGGTVVAGLAALGIHHFNKKQAPPKPLQNPTPYPNNQGAGR